jgi:hypothetical protein
MFLRSRRDLCPAICRMGPNRGRVGVEYADESSNCSIDDKKQNTIPMGAQSPSEVPPEAAAHNSSGAGTGLLGKPAHESGESGALEATAPESSVNHTSRVVGNLPDIMSSIRCSMKAQGQERTWSRSSSSLLQETACSKATPSISAVSSCFVRWRAQEDNSVKRNADLSSVIAALGEAETIHQSGMLERSKSVKTKDDGNNGAAIISTPRWAMVPTSPTSAFSDVISHHQKRGMVAQSVTSTSVQGGSVDRAPKRARPSPVEDSFTADHRSTSRVASPSGRFERSSVAMTLAARRRLLEGDQDILRRDYLRQATMTEKLRVEAALMLLQQQKLELQRKLLQQRLDGTTASTRMQLVAAAVAAAGRNNGNAATAAATTGRIFMGASHEYEALLRQMASAGSAARNVSASTSDLECNALASSLAQLLASGAANATRFSTSDSSIASGMGRRIV